VILAGALVREDNVQLLADMLDGDELATKLEQALEYKSDMVSLTAAERDRIVTVLTEPPWGLIELRGQLVKQLGKLKEREHSARRFVHDERLRGTLG